MMVILAGVVCCFETEVMDKHMSCSLGLAAVCMDKEREGDGQGMHGPSQSKGGEEVEEDGGLGGTPLCRV
jgi:hypothetical protein